MKALEVLTIENYDYKDIEFSVGKGTNNHKVFVHNYTCYDIDKDGYEDNLNEWHTVVMVGKESLFAVAHEHQADEWQSAFRVFAKAYETACRHIGVKPCIQY